MNIYQAAKAVAEGRADGFRREGWIIKPDLYVTGDVMLSDTGEDWCPNLELLTATDYELVGAKPRTERVEEKMYGIKFTDNNNPNNYCDTLYFTADRAQKYLDTCVTPGIVVEFKTVFDRPLPEEVTWTEAIVNIQDSVPTNYATVRYLPAAWIGKKVRVELI